MSIFLVIFNLRNLLYLISLDDYTPEELLMSRPGPDDRYFENATVIFGHTPTDGQMLRTDTWINIDTGAAMGGSPMLLRLDDEKEFYIE